MSVVFDEDPPLRHVRQPLPHDSAAKHVQGAALYIDDMPEPEGTLHIAIGGAPVARGRIVSLDLEAVRAAPGVVAVLTAADVPGKNDIAPSRGDEPALADGEVIFHGQPVFAVVASDRDAARRAARLGKVVVEAEKPSVTVEDALQRGETVLPDYVFRRGDVRAALEGAQHRWKARSASAGRSISTWRGRSRSPCRARTGRCTFIPPPSTPRRCSTSAPASSASPMRW